MYVSACKRSCSPCRRTSETTCNPITIEGVEFGHVGLWASRFLPKVTRLCVYCRSPIVLPLSCPRPVHVHQSGCSLIHRTALWKTSLLRKKGSTHEQRERERKTTGIHFECSRHPSTSTLQGRS